MILSINDFIRHFMFMKNLNSNWVILHVICIMLQIGIVGRTGAGKSSLVMALFRLIEPVSGNIEVDGENLTVLGLHDCRSKLTILPQVL